MHLSELVMETCNRASQKSQYYENKRAKMLGKVQQT